MRKLAVLCAFILVLPHFVLSRDPNLNDDVLGLIVFKADLHDPSSKLVSWNEDDNSACNWEGVKCNPRTNRVTELALDGFSLSGRIGRGLLQLGSLRRLSLSKNNFTGSLNPGLARLKSLSVIDLSENGLSGAIPNEFFQQCGSLRAISLAKNSFSGEIPPSLGSCTTLAALNLSSNKLSGSFSGGLWSLNGLRSLDLSDNLLEGEIPKGIERLYNLRTLTLQKNKFSGSLPEDIGGCLLLKSVDLSENSLSGNLPDSMKRLTMCSSVNLRSNSLDGKLPAWIGEMTSLQFLDLSSNRFSGEIPESIGNLIALKELIFSRNNLRGNFPASMVECKALVSTDFSRNSLTGNLPSWIFELGLESISVSGNRLTGSIEIPAGSEDRVYPNFRFLDFSVNLFSGEIPSNIGLLSNLQFLNLSTNSLTGEIPTSIGELKAMDVLDLSDNRLNGSIPSEIERAAALKKLSIDKNSLAGVIPTQIGKCSSLTLLTLSHNNFMGPIPTSIANLTNLEILNFSFNNFTGTIPKNLSNLPHLVSFNISYNHLQGELPAGPFFNTIPPSSLSGNPSLCGSAVNRSCPAVLPKPIVLNPNSSSDSSDPGSFNSNLHHKKIILSISALIAIGAAVMIALGVVLVTLLNLRVRSVTSRSAVAITLSGAGDDDNYSRSPATDSNSGKLVLFSGDPELSTGTHALLNKDCELGRGGFGAVYRTVLGDGRPVAIKKLTVSSLVKSQEYFEREVKKLGKISYQNLISLEGYYWTPSLQLLIYEFVSGGSLYKHLHENTASSSFLLWQDRFNIILGIAKSLDHLHKMNVIHYNLKSSNVLIDGSGEPKVGDFGLAKLLPTLDRYVLSSKIQSALGYMAPEFACTTVKITEKCDVYGFGVLVLEIVTGRRPVEYMEDDVVVLCDMVRGALEEGRVEECIDPRLRGEFLGEEAVPVMKLGLICTSQVPSNRPDMAEVVNILELIRCPAESPDSLG
ncbi:probable LRR receptor-like serine/threonine-protein kinase IRK [Aristolochia californica]|uniref:probable LRR receptor-like serine/threonine-protein kinase IRK n=1 Tax=Aristolochia californica TaxID=171875 RepID=UPI0035D62F5F